MSKIIEFKPTKSPKRDAKTLLYLLGAEMLKHATQATMKFTITAIVVFLKSIDSDLIDLKTLSVIKPYFSCSDNNEQYSFAILQYNPTKTGYSYEPFFTLSSIPPEVEHLQTPRITNKTISEAVFSYTDRFKTTEPKTVCNLVFAIKIMQALAEQFELKYMQIDGELLTAVFIDRVNKRKVKTVLSYPVIIGNGKYTVTNAVTP